MIPSRSRALLCRRAPPPCVRFLSVVALALLSACGARSPAAGAEHERAAAARAHVEPDPRLCFSLARSARVGEPFRLELVRGAMPGGVVADSLDEAFDPFAMRLGGMQQLVEPDVAVGRAGVTLSFASTGDALVGFSTRPRACEVGGERVELAQHVKCVLPVTERNGDVNPSSAAVAERFGLRLEIVPMIDPLPLLEGEQLPLRVRFDGPGLAGCTVRMQHRPRGGAAAADREHAADGAGADGAAGSADAADSIAVTDGVGTVVLPVRGPGEYLVTAEHRDGTRLDWAALGFTTGGAR